MPRSNKVAESRCATWPSSCAMTPASMAPSVASAISPRITRIRPPGSVNALTVAHNYEREHQLNMWFVLAARSRDDIARLIAAIERETGYPVLDLPREAEYFIELRLTA